MTGTAIVPSTGNPIVKDAAFDLSKVQRGDKLVITKEDILKMEHNTWKEGVDAFRYAADKAGVKYQMSWNDMLLQFEIEIL